MRADAPMSASSNSRHQGAPQNSFAGLAFNQPRKIFALSQTGPSALTDYSILEPVSAGQIGAGAKHVIGIGTAPCFAVK